HLRRPGADGAAVLDAVGFVRARGRALRRRRRRQVRAPLLQRLSRRRGRGAGARRSEEHTSELQSLAYLVCRLLLEKKKLIMLISNRPQNSNDVTTAAFAI